MKDVQAVGIRVRGSVQGVGFRPTVWRLATELGLAGDVRNDGDGVYIRLWATPQDAERLVHRLQTEAPPLARIDGITTQALADGATRPPAGAGFQIVASQTSAANTDIAPDAATCPACLAEIRDPTNRRYRYAFTNCTHCGPRLSIIRSLPYDRANTSMAEFVMCSACQAEYDDPRDRRFHAQPNACPDCGPELILEDDTGHICARGAAAIDACAERIRAGQVVAIKGLGGFHLACDAGNANAVDALRARKQRPHKAFALMAADRAMVAAFARIDAAEQALLADRAAPIVLLERVESPAPPADAWVCESVAPGQTTLGVMLPYTPLHHLLLEAIGRPIVLTSGNASGAPQCIDNAQARSELVASGLAAAMLSHDRPIVHRLDDSVVRVMGGIPRSLRRARGYAPDPLPLPADAPGDRDITAYGAELKSTFGLVRGRRAIISPYIGDLEDVRTLQAFQASLRAFRTLYHVQVTDLVCDRHPDYLSTQHALAEGQGLERGVLQVQHHHAHILATMLEHQLPLASAPVLGLALDGLGLGDDGTLWGGELLLCDYSGARRIGHLEPIPLPGAAQAVRQPWRNTVAHLEHVGALDALVARGPQCPLAAELASHPIEMVRTMIHRRLNAPLTSACGRWFDAVAGALGLCADGMSYEGQAAMELEALADRGAKRLARLGVAPEAEPWYPFGRSERADRLVITVGPLWHALVADRCANCGPDWIALAFHNGLIKALASAVIQLANRYGTPRVVLGGGVFQNRRLLEGIERALQRAGLDTLSPQAFPANDGGIALGQLAAALARSRP